MVTLRARAASVWRAHAVREWAGAFAWVGFSLCAVTACNSARVRGALAMPPETPAESLLLASVAGQVALWDYFGLAVGLTLNPALALAYCHAGRISPRSFGGVLAGQFLGHLMAVRATRAFMSDYFVSKVRLYAPPEPLARKGMSFANAVAMEAGLTCLLAFAALSVDRLVRGQRMQSVAMLCLIVSITAVGQGYTDSMLNPAMTLALAFYDSGSTLVAAPDQFVYWVGPLCGALVGSSLHNALFYNPTDGDRALRKIQKQQAAAKVE